MLKRDKVVNRVLSVIFIFLSLAWIYPMFMILMDSLKQERAITTSSAFQLPTADTFAGAENYVNAVSSKGFLQAFGYTVLITVTSVVLILVCCSMCAWFITRINDRFSKFLYFLFVFSMKDGFVQQIGTPQEVYSHPANLFVAGFIGVPQMNFFDALLAIEDDGYSVKTSHAKIKVSDRIAALLKARDVKEGAVTLGVRPEHFILCSPGSEGAVDGKVEVSEMMGSAVHVHVNTGTSDVVMVIPTLDLSADYVGKFKNSSGLTFTFNPDSMHLFDRDTGNNLI